MNHNVAGLITHQLNRGAEEEVGTLSNISFGDAFGQDLDLGLRVVTGKVDGIDRSALVVMGGREVPFDGILVNNVPCCDYNEVGPITNMKIVERLMKREQEEDEEEEGGGKTDYAAKNRAKSKTRSNALSNAGKQARSAFKGVTYDGGAKGEEEDVAEAS
jgi:hypothetical protein